MEGLALATTTNSSDIRPFIPSGRLPTIQRTRNVSFRRKPYNFVVFATSNDDPQLDRWDQMELKFGQLIGEDPKLTLAKIMGKKMNPDISYMEIEKMFHKKKGKMDIKEVPFDVSMERKTASSLDGLNLVRPVPKKGVKFEVDRKPLKPVVKKPSPPAKLPVVSSRGSLPNVILRKPTTFSDDDIGKSPTLRYKPNLTLGTANKQNKENFSDMTLLRKPEPISQNLTLDQQEKTSSDSNSALSDGMEGDVQRSASGFTEATNEVTLQTPPKQMNFGSNINETLKSSDVEESKPSDDIKLTRPQGPSSSFSRDSAINDDPATGLQPLEPSEMESPKNVNVANAPLEMEILGSDSSISVEAALLGKPKRLDQSIKGTSEISREEVALPIPENNNNAVELESFLATSPIKEHEDKDWKKAEEMLKTSGREDVELISASTRGFVVSFGSLVGFLPYRNLTAKWKFLAFESWLRKKGLDPSKYKQNIGSIGNYGIESKDVNDVTPGSEAGNIADVGVSPDMNLEDLVGIYEQEKLRFLSSFVGQKMRVNVVMADKSARRLIFSLKPKEKEETVQRKRALMAKLSIGDVVTCCIKKITYFGIFVEVEGVAALIHQAEVSWDPTLEPESYFKLGQIVEAKVHQLDYSLERIFLSLKEITPDPLIGAWEAVVGDQDPLVGTSDTSEEDPEWTDVESLIKELEQFEGIQSVSKGRFSRSPGLAPTFQVYMASMFENEYKLLARAGNKVQEVIVQTSLGKEEMKSAITTCTSRVE